MKAERNGSYSTVSIFAGIFFLLYEKSIVAESALVSAALMARRDAPERVASALASIFLQQRLVRRVA